MKNQPPAGEYTPEQRKGMIQAMQMASNAFYSMARQCGVHAFIEFTGLMNEFITVCRKAEDDGIDFTMANTHTGKQLPFKEHHLKYLAEKLNCIYGPALLSDPKLRDVFIVGLLGEHFQVMPYEPERLGPPNLVDVGDADDDD